MPVYTNEIRRGDALPPGSELHGYCLEKALGAGSFSITYLATHGIFHTKHVIKEFMPDYALREGGVTVRPKSESERALFEWGFARFFDEARLLHSFSHPNVVKVTDVFEANGTAYFVMPYLEGRTLRDVLEVNPCLDKDTLLDIFFPLLEGLKYIHGKNVLHRDIKPENIYIQRDGVPVLIDFGAARQAIGVKSKALTQVFTAHYAPHEQYSATGEKTAALDLYSLGACMFQAITRDLPAEAPSRVQRDTNPKLAGSDLERQYGHGFLAAVDKSLAVWPGERFQSGLDFQMALLADDTREAGPVPPADSRNIRLDAGHVASDIAKTGKVFFGKLTCGDFGLARTYWLYGVLVSLGVNLLIGLIPVLGVQMALMIVGMAYQILVFIGVWRAAGRYRGRKVWAVLAKIAVVLGVLASLPVPFN
jgi:serine/threonine protein kinase